MESISIQEFIIGQQYRFEEGSHRGIVEITAIGFDHVACEVIEGCDGIYFFNDEGLGKGFSKYSSFAQWLVPCRKPHELPEINSEEFFNLIG